MYTDELADADRMLVERGGKGGNILELAIDL